jgi:hypothetical protein
MKGLAQTELLADSPLAILLAFATADNLLTRSGDV